MIRATPEAAEDHDGEVEPLDFEAMDMDESALMAEFPELRGNAIGAGDQSSSGGESSDGTQASALVIPPLPQRPGGLSCSPAPVVAGLRGNRGPLDTGATPRVYRGEPRAARVHPAVL